MGLKLNIKPGERFYVGTGAVTVISDHIVSVIVDGDAPVLRAEDHVEASAATTPIAALRYTLQQMYLTGDTTALHGRYFQQGQALWTEHPELQTILTQLNALLMQGQTYKAIRLAKTLSDTDAQPTGLRLVEG